MGRSGLCPPLLSEYVGQDFWRHLRQLAGEEPDILADTESDEALTRIPRQVFYERFLMLQPLRGASQRRRCTLLLR